jgi:3-deoxy-D-manno-octulosonic-acid transferase
MSERSFRTWRAFSPVARAILQRVDLFLAQTPGDAERLRQLGAERVTVSGNLKFDVPPPSADGTVLEEMRRAIGDRPVFVAASTHPGEEAAVIEAHSQVSRSGRRLLTILAPRHPLRGDALAAEIAAAGLSVRRRSKAERIDMDTEIFLADTIGEMGLWYRLADLAFLGGSIVRRGGQNPIEPAKLQVPILHGKHVGNFRDIYDALATCHAAKRVDDGASLAESVKLLIDDEAERARLRREAEACIERFSGALERTLDALEPYVASVCSGYETSART